MSESKRGRPPKPETERRQQIGVRTSPSLKADLERAAAENGRSVAQEAEMRLVASFDAERVAGGIETNRLLNMLANEIAVIEGVTRKRWFKDLATWSAVADAGRAVIARLRPDKPRDDEVVKAAFDELYKILQAKKPLLEELRQAGVGAVDLPKPFKRVGVFGNPFDKDRSSERRQIATMPHLDEPERAALIETVDKLVVLDDEEREAAKRHGEALSPYFHEEERGSQIYEQIKRGRWEREAATGNYQAILDDM